MIVKRPFNRCSTESLEVEKISDFRAWHPVDIERIRSPDLRQESINETGNEQGSVVHRTKDSCRCVVGSSFQWKMRVLFRQVAVVVDAASAATAAAPAAAGGWLICAVRLLSLFLHSLKRSRLASRLLKPHGRWTARQRTPREATKET